VYTDEVTVNIIPAVVPIFLRTIGAQSGGYTLLNGGVTVPNTGVYLIFYKVLPNSTVSVVISSSIVGVIPDSAFGNASDNTVVQGALIVSLVAGENLSLVSNDTSGVWDTVITPKSTVTPNPAEMLLLQLE
jgi:hypothetical protein